MASVKTNILLNSINTVTSIIFPVITFPYAARILLPDGIGSVNFLNSIVSYIVLLTSLGIPMYAVKEIAKYQDSIEKRDKTAIEILLLSVVLCILGYVIVWLLAKYVPTIHHQSSLFYILSLTIILNAVGVNWFYQGIEDFRFITINGIIIRTISASALFVFVRDSSDLLIYGCIVVGSTVGNNILNAIHFRKYLSIKAIKLKKLNILRHLKPSGQVFIFNLITSLYIQLNSIMLGFMSGDTEVGYFTAGTKISHIGLTIISSLGTVLLPHCSYLLKKGDLDTFRSVIHKSLNLTLALSWPMTIGLMILAVPITIIFCGIEYYDAVPVLLLNAPVIVFISLTNLMGIQILYPMNNINIVIWSVSGGAVMNLLLNIFLIPIWGAKGAAVSTLVAEFVVLVIQIICGRTYYPFKLRDIINPKYLIGAVLMGICTYFSIIFISSLIFKLITGVSVGIIVYFVFLYAIKDQMMIQINNQIISKIRHAR